MLQARDLAGKKRTHEVPPPLGDRALPAGSKTLRNLSNAEPVDRIHSACILSSTIRLA